MSAKEWKINWEEEFKRDYSVEKFQEVNHYWWKDCYDQIEEFVLKNVPLDKKSELLECGCGSGNSSLRLAHLVKRVILLDFSDAALSCARKLAYYHGAKNVEFVKGDAFGLPFQDNQFDLCWNIGVIEHYNFEGAKKIVREMLRVVKDGGRVIIGTPNFMSLPVIKARLLSLKILMPLTFWIKGYRVKDEIKYNLKDLKNLVFLASKENGARLDKISYCYVGSILPVETPGFIFAKVNKFLSRVFSRFSFLVLISAKVEK